VVLVEARIAYLSEQPVMPAMEQRVCHRWRGPQRRQVVGLHWALLAL
jgi:hypothetical protein